MRFMVAYECKHGGNIFEGQFEFDSEQEPMKTDPLLIDAARRDSTKFCGAGMFGLSITSIAVVASLPMSRPT